MVLVIVALCFTALMIVVALVIDYGYVRQTRQENKLAADVSVTAGLRELTVEGRVLPWRGACAALTYLEANADLGTATVSFLDGAGSAVAGDPCAAGNTTECVAGTPSTWAWIRVSDGAYTADIRAGYETPDPAFAEDAAAYSGDNGAPALGGCDQLAVIIADGDPAFFGGVAGADGYDTVSRSVGRIEIGRTGEVAVALVLLEQEDCETLNFQGAAGGRIIVRGTGDRPGIIHADSSGTGECVAGAVVLEGKRDSSSNPLVLALSAPDNPAIHGVISTFARSQGGTNDAIWTGTRSMSDVWDCDPDHPTGDGTPVTTCEAGPIGSDRVTRTPADDRYLADVTELRTEANSVFNGIIADGAPGNPGDYVRYSADLGLPCALEGGGSSPPPVVITTAEVPTGKLFVDCALLDVKNNHQLRIEGSIDEVAFLGGIAVAGSGIVDIQAPEAVLIHNQDGLTEAVSSSGTFLINGDGFASCFDRHAADPTSTTELVVRAGGLTAVGSAAVRMCSTFVHLMGGTNSPAPVNTASSSYPAPYSNSQDGIVNVGGGGNVEWTAPNTEAGQPTAGSYRFEDLAVWTETSADHYLRGGGGMVLAGVFFFPNTGPETGPGGLTVVGSSAGDIDFDAQLWARKLTREGGGNFIMQSNPADSILLPFLTGTGLVR